MLLGGGVVEGMRFLWFAMLLFEVNLITICRWGFLLGFCVKLRVLRHSLERDLCLLVAVGLGTFIALSDGCKIFVVVTFWTRTGGQGTCMSGRLCNLCSHCLNGFESATSNVMAI